TAVVALETTLVAHGFPAGEGLAAGLEAERRVREAGAVPATIGVLDGRIRVGLSREELERFDADARKVGPRDIAASVVQGAVGAGRRARRGSSPRRRLRRLRACTGSSAVQGCSSRAPRTRASTASSR